MTLSVVIQKLPDGLYGVHCLQFPEWRPLPVQRVDKAEMEGKLKAHQTRRTQFQWFGWDERA